MNLPPPTDPTANVPVPPPSALAPPGPPAAPAGDPGGAARPRRRRVAITIVVLVALVAIGVAVWSLTSGDDDGGGSATEAPASLVRIDTDASELLVYDELGEELQATLELSDGGFPRPLEDGRVFDGEALDAGELRVYDVAAASEASVEEYRLDEPGGFVFPVGEQLLVVGPVSGLGEVQVVDTATGDVDGLAAALGLETRWSIPVVDVEAGALLALGIDLDDPTWAVLPASGIGDAWTIAGRPLDLGGGDRAVVAFPDGTDATELSMVGPEGRIGDAAELDGVVTGGLVVGDERALVVDLDGRLHEFDGGAGSIDELDDLDVGEVQRVQPLAADRLLVVGLDASVLLDGEGAVLARWGADEIDQPVVDQRGSRCVSLRPADAGAVDAGGVLVDLSTGATLVDLEGRPVGPAGDGCSFIVFGVDADQVVIAGEEVPLDEGDRASGVDPARGRVLVRSGDGGRAYRLIDLEGETVADLGDGPWILVS